MGGVDRARAISALISNFSTNQRTAEKAVPSAHAHRPLSRPYHE
jgi:hypothetical protein